MIGATLESWHSRAMRVVIERVDATGACLYSNGQDPVGQVLVVRAR